MTKEKNIIAMNLQRSSLTCDWEGNYADTHNNHYPTLEGTVLKSSAGRFPLIKNPNTCPPFLTQAILNVQLKAYLATEVSQFMSDEQIEHDFFRPNLEDEVECLTDELTSDDVLNLLNEKMFAPDMDTSIKQRVQDELGDDLGSINSNEFIKSVLIGIITREVSKQTIFWTNLIPTNNICDDPDLDQYRWGLR
jgi:hypothetical protein